MLNLTACDACGATAFPPPLLCPACASENLHAFPVQRGVLVACTEYLGTKVGTVRTALGPVVVARIHGDAVIGAPVALVCDDGVPEARTAES